MVKTTNQGRINTSVGDCNCARIQKPFVYLDLFLSDILESRNKKISIDYCAFSFCPNLLKFKRWIRLYLKFVGKIMNAEYFYHTHGHITKIHKQKLLWRQNLLFHLNQLFSRVPASKLFQFHVGKKMFVQNSVFKLRISFIIDSLSNMRKKIIKRLRFF